MRWGDIIVAALLLGTAAPAQVAGLRSLGSQVYDAVTRGEAAPSTIGALLRDSINGQQGLCLDVGAYQIFRQTAGAVTMKADCGPQGVYLVSADAAGQIRASGGDGSVAAPNPVDGPVVATRGAAGGAPQPGNGAAAAPETALKVAPSDSSELMVAPRGTHDDVLLWSAVAAIAAFFLAVALFAHANSVRRTVGGHDRILPLSSADKDRLVAEATELREDLFRHPTGVLIVRGKRGKRRLFPNRLYAELYRRLGVKIAQIR